MFSEKDEKPASPSFYDSFLDEAGKAGFHRAVEVRGIDEEIALLRVKLISCMDNSPESLELTIRTLKLLDRLVRTRHAITGGRSDQLAAAQDYVVRNLAVPLGVPELFANRDSEIKNS